MTRSVRPELVEGLPFSSGAREKEGQGFDRLSPNGGWSLRGLMTRSVRPELVEGLPFSSGARD
jgi:hypothetical protein